MRFSYLKREPGDRKLFPMPGEPITSRQNNWIRRVRRAIDRHDREVLLEGPKMIRDALDHGLQPVAILEDAERPSGFDGGLRVDPKLFREISETTTSQGVIALVHRPQSPASVLEIPPRRIVALDAVQDPGNVGTILRLCAAFEVTAVVRLPGTADPWSPRALRASAGSTLLIPVLQMDVAALLELCRRRGLAILTASPDGSSYRVERYDVVLVLGSEGRGVSPELLSAGQRVRIPMSKRVESLNVAASAAILLSRMYED
jgi:RNA methyltransferase, TrmH family